MLCTLYDLTPPASQTVRLFQRFQSVYHHSERADMTNPTFSTYSIMWPNITMVNRHKIHHSIPFVRSHCRFLKPKLTFAHSPFLREEETSHSDHLDTPVAGFKAQRQTRKSEGLYRPIISAQCQPFPFSCSFPSTRESNCSILLLGSFFLGERVMLPYLVNFFPEMSYRRLLIDDCQRRVSETCYLDAQ